MKGVCCLKNYQLSLHLVLSSRPHSQPSSEWAQPRFTCVYRWDWKTNIRGLFHFSNHLTPLSYLENSGNYPPSQHSIRVSSENLWIHCKASAVYHKRHFLWSHCLRIAAWRQSAASMAFLGIKIFWLSLISILEMTVVCVFRSRQHATDLGTYWTSSVSAFRI